MADKFLDGESYQAVRTKLNAHADELNAIPSKYAGLESFDGIATKTTNTNNRVLFDGTTQTALDVSINEGVSTVWRAANKCIIVPVSAVTTVRIVGRTGQTVPPLTNVWLTSNSHNVDENPAFLNGTLANSKFTGDGDYTVPVGATYLYIALDLSRAATVKVTDLSSTLSYAIKPSALSDFIDTAISGTTGKSASAGAFKSIYDRFALDTAGVTLFDGTKDVALSGSINEGASKIWVVANKCVIVPVVAGHTIKVEGRTSQTIALTGLWLTTNSHVTGDTPSFLTGDFATSKTTGDGNFVAPAGALYYYLLLDNPRALTVKVSDITAASLLKLKADALPKSISDAIDANTATVTSLKPVHKYVTTKYTDVAVNVDCNLYFDAMTTEPDKGSPCSNIAITSSSLLVRGVKNLKYKPTATASNFDATLSLRDYNFNLIDSKVKTFRTIASTGKTGTKRIMYLGDSYVHLGLFPREASRLLRAAGYTIEQIGTIPGQYTTTAPITNQTEGYSGQTWNFFVNVDSASILGVTKSNPFRSGGVLNIPNYFSVNGYSGIDHLFISLGVNDFSFGTAIITDAEIATIIATAKTFLNAFLAYAPQCQITLTLPTVGAVSDFKNLLSQAFRKYNSTRGAMAYITNFDNGAFHPNVRLCDAGQWVDRQNGYVTTSIPSADRLAGITELRYDDYIHPSTNGFSQFADAVYSKVLSIEAGNAG